jgi:hypothetical protein
VSEVVIGLFPVFRDELLRVETLKMLGNLRVEVVLVPQRPPKL